MIPVKLGIIGVVNRSQQDIIDKKSIEVNENYLIKNMLKLNIINNNISYKYHILNIEIDVYYQIFQAINKYVEFLDT